MVCGFRHGRRWACRGSPNSMHSALPSNYHPPVTAHQTLVKEIFHRAWSLFGQLFLDISGSWTLMRIAVSASSVFLDHCPHCNKSTLFFGLQMEPGYIYSIGHVHILVNKQPKPLVLLLFLWIKLLVCSFAFSYNIAFPWSNYSDFPEKVSGFAFCLSLQPLVAHFSSKTDVNPHTVLSAWFSF